MAEQLTEDEKALIGEIECARISRQRFVGTYNSYFDNAAPWKQRVKNKTDAKEPRAPADQEDIFDGTLQEVADDFASSVNDELTPAYRDWTKHEPVKSLDTGIRKQIEPLIKARKDLVYDTIRASTFEEASQESYLDLGIGPCSMMIRYTRIGQPIDCEYVPLSELLIAPGPHGGVGLRFWERSVKVSHLDTVWPKLDWGHLGTEEQRKKNKRSVIVLEGGRRDWEADQEAWDWYVISNGKVLDTKRFTGRGSCPLQVGRTLVSHPSAYGVGPGGKALAPARTLNELAYLNLKRLGKVVDPPGIFSDPSGVLNPEGGFEAGMWHEAADGFAVEELSPGGDMREVYFSKQDLELSIRRAMYQDKPYQRGATPPSASQWIGEEQMAAQRKTLYRARMHNEWVIPLIERFEWILRARGALEDIKHLDEVIDVQPVSPLSRAADLGEVQAADQVITMFASRFGEAGLQYIKMGETLANVKKRLGDEVVSIKTDEEVAQERQQAMAAEMAAQGMGGAGG